MKKIAKLIRSVTAPPIMAAVFIAILYAADFLTGTSALWSLFFLGILPVLAYPICSIIPKLRAGGRNTERKLAVILSVSGYLFGFLKVMIFGGSSMELLLFSSYLISGLLIAVFSYVLRIRSSGHAAAVAGPITMLALRVSPWYWLALLILAAVFWSSVELRRHTLVQLFLGAAFSVVPTLLLYAPIMGESIF